MKQISSCRMAARVGLTISAAVLMAACQDQGHQGAPIKSLVASSQTAPLASAATAIVAAAAYTPPATVSQPLYSCNLEYVDAITLLASVPAILKNGQSHTFKGWIDGSGYTQPTYWLRFDDPTTNRYLQMPLALTIRRPDVQKADTAAPLVSGFNVNLPASALPAGRYHVYLATKSGDATHVCDNNRSIEIEP